MVSDVFLTFIVPSQDVGRARQLAAALDAGGVGMFTAELSPTGQAPATHYISTGFVSPAWAQLVRIAEYTCVGEAWQVTSRTPGDADMIAAQAMAAGVAITVEEVTAMLDRADVTAEPWQMAIERLQLQPVVE